MKKLLPLLLLVLCFSCSAQRVEQLPIHTVNAWVKDSYNGITKLQPNDSRFEIEVASDSTLVENKEYVFWLEITDCIGCRTIQAVVVKHSLTTYQIQRDQAQISAELSQRIKIRLKR